MIVATESFPRDAFEAWTAVEDNAHVIGDFVWTGIDYLGESGIGKSTLLKRIYAHDLAAVPAELMKWTKGTAGGVKRELRGLVERRKAEAALWERG